MNENTRIAVIIVLSFALGFAASAYIFIADYEQNHNLVTRLVYKCDWFYGEDGWKIVKNDEDKWTCVSRNNTQPNVEITMPEGWANK